MTKKIAVFVGSLRKESYNRKMAIGGFGGNHHLRQSLVFLDVPPMQQPEAYIGGAAQLFDAHGNIITETTREFLGRFMESFAAWVARNFKGN